MTRVIKKYPNRRLYDTSASRYIKLADIRDLVINGTDFKVIDKKSGASITRSILLQVISEQEQLGDPIMSEAFLAQVIRAYGTDAPGFVGRHLEKSLVSFIARQKPVRGEITPTVMDDISAAAAVNRKTAG